MASIRRIKRDIDFLANEVISDCYMALYFNDGAKREQIVAVTRASCGSTTLRCAAT